jgi:hypothetical protein
VVTIAAGAAVALENTGAIERGIDRVTSGVSDNSPDTAPAGATRLASLSLNGRRQAWHFAWDMTRDHPLAGAGMGSFSREWGSDRTVQYLYILQPHSLELELLGELGIVGFGLFVVLVVCAFGCVVAGRAGRRRSAIAAALIVALLAEVSVDWTWSVPAVVVPALLVVGAAGGGSRLRWQRVSSAATVPVLAAAAVALGLPFLADRELDRGRALAADNPSRAWTLSVDSRKLNPWDERVYALQGRLAGESGLSNLVVEKYDKAASLSRQPWHAYFQEAASLDPKDVNAVRRACHLARASDPLEPAFDYGPCNGVR